MNRFYSTDDAGAAGPAPQNEQSNEYNEQEDIGSNKLMAALAYLLFFLPLVTEPGKTSKFARFHANQGLIFLIFYAAFIIITRIIDAIFFRSWGGFWLGILFNAIFGIIYFVMAVFAAINAWKAYNGKWCKLPLIGNISIIK